MKDTHSTFATSVTAWSKREHVLPGLALLAVTAAAWGYTVSGSAAMGGPARPGTLGHLALFLIGWTAMMVAMMLPATLPLILLYSTIARRRFEPGPATVGMGALLVGYFGIWTVSGLPVYAYHLLAARAGPITWVGPGLLLIAGGLYQFTALKNGCRSRCSNPVAFLAQRWRPGVRGAARLGLLHGLDCLGCCLGLMVALVGLGMAHFAWMLTATLVVFVEKTHPMGHRMARPLGVALVAAGLVMLAMGLRVGFAAL